MRKYLSIFLIAIMITMLFFTAPRLAASPDDYTIWYKEQYNSDGTSLMLVWLYRMVEAEPSYDFYIVKFRVIDMCASGLYHVETCIVSNGIINDWEPESGIYYYPVSLSVSVGGIGFGIAIPAEVVDTTEGLMPNFGWAVSTTSGSPDLEFVSSWYVPDGVDFAFLVQASSWREYPLPPIGGPSEELADIINVYYPYQFTYKTLDVKSVSQGTTRPKPGTYTQYPAGFTASIWAYPYSGYLLDYWDISEYVPSGGTVGTTVDGSHNPLMQTMNDDYSVKPYFAYDFRVLARDHYGKSLTTGDVYIDGKLVGYTGSNFPVAKGTHKVFVNDFWEARQTGNRYTFDRWDDWLANPRTIYVYKAKTIRANFQKEKCAGDVNGDGVCDLFDVTFVAIHFGSKRDIGDPWPSGNNWDSRADTVCTGSSYGCIDIYDLNNVIKYKG